MTGLRKSYGDKVVLDGVDFTVAPGTVFALLGPNGAGKTTIVNILATLLRPDGGVARVGGTTQRPVPPGSADEVQALRQRVAALEQQNRDLEVMLEMATDHADDLSETGSKSAMIWEPCRR